VTRGLLLGSAVAVLALIASVKLWEYAAQPGSFVGYDLVAYINAAQRLMSTGSPYSAQVLAGPVANIPDNVPIGYFYPPPVAQLFVPLAGVPYQTVAAAWIVLQLAAAAVVLPRVIPVGALGRRLLIVGLVGLASQPFQMALLGGNVSGWLAIAVGAMLVASAPGAGAVAAVATLVKLTPIPLLVTAVAARPSRTVAVATIVAICGVSALLNLQAWVDWVAVLPNILRNEMSTGGSNLSPAHLVVDLGLRGLAGVVELAVAGGFAIWALAYARIDRELSPRAVSVAIAATTFASSTMWDHYLAVFVPLTLFWWFRVGVRRRLWIVAGNGILGGLWLGLETYFWYRVLVLAAVIAFFAVVCTCEVLRSEPVPETELFRRAEAL